MHWVPSMGTVEWLRCPIHTGCLPLVPCRWQRTPLCPLGAPQIGVGVWRSQGCEVQGTLGSLEVPGVEALGFWSLWGFQGWGFRGSPLTWTQLEAANR